MGKSSESTAVQSPIEDLATTVPLVKGHAEPAPFEPTPWDRTMLEMGPVKAAPENALTNITGNAQVFSRVPGYKYFWEARITDGEGKTENVMLDDKPTGLPEGEKLTVELDKSLPLGAGVYKIRVRLQLVPPSWGDRSLDDPVLRKQVEGVEGRVKVTVL